MTTFPRQWQCQQGCLWKSPCRARPEPWFWKRTSHHYRRVFQQAVSALQGVGDRVEEAGLGVAYVAMDGLEALYGGDEMLARALLDALPQTLLPRVGVGHGKFPALVAARNSEPLGLTKVPADAADFLSSRSTGTAAGIRGYHIRAAPVRPAYPWARSRPWTQIC